MKNKYHKHFHAAFCNENEDWYYFMLQQIVITLLDLNS